jgi:hypothetical protein
MRARAQDDFARQVFEFRAREPVAEAETGCEERQLNFHFIFDAQTDFRLLGHLADAREHRIVLDRIGTIGGFDLLNQKVDDAFIQIISAEPGIAVRG